MSCDMGEYFIDCTKQHITATQKQSLKLRGSIRENWVCKQCGLYQKVNPNAIKAGRKVYFYKNKNIANRTTDQINVDIVKGVVLCRNNDAFITILTSTGIAKVKAMDVYPEDAPTYFVYNMLVLVSADQRLQFSITW